MDQKLTLGSKFRYGLADMGFALITSAMQFFLLYYYIDVAGINPALAGSGPDGRQTDLGCNQRSPVRLLVRPHPLALRSPADLHAARRRAARHSLPGSCSRCPRD